MIILLSVGFCFFLADLGLCRIGQDPAEKYYSTWLQI